MGDDLAAAVGDEPVPSGLQLPAQLAVVVDFPLQINTTGWHMLRIG